MKQYQLENRNLQSHTGHQTGYLLRTSGFSRRVGRNAAFTLSWIVIALTLFFIPMPPALAEVSSNNTEPSAQTLQKSDFTVVKENKAVSAASLFTLNCAGCHANGGNVVRRGKTLKQKALKRYGYEEVGAIAQIITNGKGIMPAYSDRLTEEEVRAIAQYVLTQAETGW